MAQKLDWKKRHPSYLYFRRSSCKVILIIMLEPSIEVLQTPYIAPSRAQGIKLKKPYNINFECGHFQSFGLFFKEKLSSDEKLEL